MSEENFEENDERKNVTKWQASKTNKKLKIWIVGLAAPDASAGKDRFLTKDVFKNKKKVNFRWSVLTQIALRCPFFNPLPPLHY